jgi:hypothetical protein
MLMRLGYDSMITAPGVPLSMHRDGFGNCLTRAIALQGVDRRSSGNRRVKSA